MGVFSVGLRPLTLCHPTLIRFLRPSMPVEGAGFVNS